MNNKVNYTAVGLMVILGMALMMAFTYWMLKPSKAAEVQIYSILFDESVLGLNEDAVVKYRGITVGKVTTLRINPKNSEQVEVLVQILKSTPVKETTVAKLTAQGITGLSYINLNLGSNGASPLVAKDGNEYPVIKTEVSFFERIDKSIDSVSAKLSKTLTGTSKLLNDENQKQMALTLKSTAAFMQNMEKLVDDNFINNTQASMQQLNSATKKLDEMMPKIDRFIDSSMKWEDKIALSFASIMKSYTGIKGSMSEIERAVASGEFNFKDIASDVVPTLNNSLVEMQYMMIKIGSALNKYERSPNDIIFKQEEIKKGPGEK